jgi:hypothetical protein|tara:strand:+ start:54 stop:188 length:135 start_codon:yes stop_codon:yes gene_type:complete
MKHKKEIKNILKECIKYIDKAKEYGQKEEDLINKILTIINNKDE